MNRLSRLLVVLSTGSLLTVPAFAGQVLGDMGGVGLDSLIMAIVLLVFGFFLQKFTKK